MGWFPFHLAGFSYDFPGFQHLGDAPKSSQDAPRTPQDAPGGPQDAPRGPKTPPRRPQDAPRRPQEAPGRPQDAPGTPQILDFPTPGPTANLPQDPPRHDPGPRTWAGGTREAIRISPLVASARSSTPSLTPAVPYAGPVHSLMTRMPFYLGRPQVPPGLPKAPPPEDPPRELEGCDLNNSRVTRKRAVEKVIPASVHTRVMSLLFLCTGPRKKMNCPLRPLIR